MSNVTINKKTIEFNLVPQSEIVKNHPDYKKDKINIGGTSWQSFYWLMNEQTFIYYLNLA